MRILPRWLADWSIGVSAAHGSVLVISSLPPRHCGIGRYAHQHIMWLQARGNKVTAIGLPPSAADYVVNYTGGLRALRLLGFIRASRHAFVHWHNEFFYRGGFVARFQTSLALLVLLVLFGQRVTMICHEIDISPPPTKRTPLRLLAHALETAIFRCALAHVGKIVFHSEAERQQASNVIGMIFPEGQVHIQQHDLYLQPFSNVSQRSARQVLGMHLDRIIFLCIGFVGEHKGFHHAINALKQLPGVDVQLVIVGSVRNDDLGGKRYLAQIREAAASDTRIVIREEFIGDETFDMYIRASDCVVATYERAFSSSVVARAKLLGRRCICSSIGGLPAQAKPDDIVIEEIGQLVFAMQKIVLDA